MESEQLLNSLNPAQREAVGQIDGPLLIIAGPGSGKTRVVTHRIAYLLHQGVPAWSILGLTFTNKSADEMRRRVQQLVPGESVWVSTFHRFCARLLRIHAPLVGLVENFSIYDVSDSTSALRDAITDLGLSPTETPATIARHISAAKQQGMTPDQYHQLAGPSRHFVAAEVYPQYQKRLQMANAVDFDDLLLHVANLLRENPELRRTLDERYRYVLVDEYQDTNRVQYSIVRMLSVESSNLAVTGDPDQSIYGWRGADVKNILQFEDDFPDAKTVTLEENYRSTPDILRVADHVISNNVKRKPKTLRTANAPGQPVRLVMYPSSKDESDAIAARIANQVHAGLRRPSDFAIFYRANHLSRQVEQSLYSLGVPYQVVRGLAFFERKEVKDIIAYLHLINNPMHDAAFVRMVNTPPRGIGKGTLAKLVARARQDETCLFEAARQSGLIPGLQKRAAVNIAKFISMFDALSVLATGPVAQLIERLLELSGYRQWLLDSGTEEDEERLANVDELCSAAGDFDAEHPEDGGLEAFLEQSSLVADTDDWEIADNSVTLMTLHAAKGLEFPVVFLVALEESILPHERSARDPDGIEEERRLFYVGITRAQQELHLSSAGRRPSRGADRIAVPSSFLMELPRDEMEVVGAPAQYEPGFDDPADSWEEPVFRQDLIPESRGGEQPTPLAIQTASEMFDDSSHLPPRLTPEQCRAGMLVTHTKYGDGRVVGVSGSGKRRSATVEFFDGSQCRFVIAFSPLRMASPDA